MIRNEPPTPHHRSGRPGTAPARPDAAQTRTEPAPADASHPTERPRPAAGRGGER
ncbi:hypothetical protein OG417_29085 [Actinoallomurus sp. NBC_01490]|uniref:hypothetical protein n=1 Tax=Actinoallomurus sp. NBC_01490 TaxID=2903557 RepID=UPI002E37671E|nr:hypothetical protein [Actinoallomurus sp. NBC_01490]